ncbi:Formate--tetrahydrofolate ligase [Sedimentisphaera cyanobacteriorum]|uniref:Formate--tetrahydrofolate ligase n=1 Tax=Sedimentisphaera cyanobacteriorum TaxID=1940790 RepID=A0A1Q2HM40_9BACT|nr:formate--tetrahydrofolate ligase [Sedimentisphaera cyanobacteriorum]AQQ08335.1 Formate--tetrahydrofolate ligase [Sedimentisphaera cyanobacteriorum]
MKLDPTVMKDWQIAKAAEEKMLSIAQLAENLGLREDELIYYGKNLAKVDYRKVLDRTEGQKKARYIDVTAITPTPLGEGKTTTTIGLVDGLGRLGKSVAGAIRQPSGGPTFNIKGSAAGGGLAQCIPLTPFSLGLTGDIDKITNAHNLCMVALNARMQHENNYDDEKLAQRNLKRLDIDPQKVQLKWVIDFCAQGLRNIRMGIGGKMDGFEMDSGFAISVSSEIMAILAVARDLKDLRERIGKIVAAYSKSGEEITTEDLEVAGAMTAWLVEAINPTLMQTMEKNPVFVHAGPFANIAIGQSSVIADRLGSNLVDFHVTESGFGADIGFEKFWNIKCRYSGLKPDAVVLVATVRALKMHGGGPEVKPGKPLPKEYTEQNVELVEKGCSNLKAHIETVIKSGVTPVVCINSFHTDTPAEIEAIRTAAEAAGAYCAVSEHWLKGGEGAEELAETVIRAADEPSDFKFLYDFDMPVKKRIELIAKEVYGADGVEFAPEAEERIQQIEQDPDSSKMATCMVKTHLSLSHDPAIKGRPEGFTLPVRDIMVYKGAGLIVPIAGTIKLMPGTGSDPAFRRIDVDTQTGKVEGLF